MRFSWRTTAGTDEAAAVAEAQKEVLGARGQVPGNAFLWCVTERVDEGDGHFGLGGGGAVRCAGAMRYTCSSYLSRI